MSERNALNLEIYLQEEDVQERIRRNMERGRSEFTVSIGRAANLFGFSENQLRDWESRGLLTPRRSKEGAGQRQYTPAELNKLAIIRELIDANYGPGEIPANIDQIWESVSYLHEQQEKPLESIQEGEHLHLDQRIDSSYEELFWRYYCSHVLRSSLMLICQDIPDTIAGLILPLQQRTAFNHVYSSWNLQEVGPSLIGWSGPNGSFYTFLDSAPSFEYPTDFRVVPLKSIEENTPTDGTLIVLQRKVKPLGLRLDVVKAVRRLLAPLYEVKDWQPYFGQGMRDLLYLAPDFNSNLNISDNTLNGIAEIVVRSGGRTNNDRDRWRFCCIMLPEDSSVPLQQRSLIVRAQSQNSPHKTGTTTISPGRYVNSLSLRAFQSGVIIYRDKISDADTTIALREIEGPMHSAIAVPAGSENGQPVAVLYVVSDEEDAFSRDDQRVLRMMGRIVEELLLTYRVRHQITKNLDELIIKPNIVDPLFGDFLSENEFIQDVEAILTGIKIRMEERGKSVHRYNEPDLDHDALPGTEQLSEKEVISFTSLDVDHQSHLASLYGEITTRNLSRTIGLRVQEMIKTLITKHTDCKLYHIYANRYYILLKGIPLEEARKKAEAIRQALEGPISIEQLKPPSRPIVLPDITIRLGITSYTYPKLEENLASNSTADAVSEVRAKITRALDVTLNMGMDEGGNVVFSWDRESRGFVRWSPLGAV